MISTERDLPGIRAAAGEMFEAALLGQMREKAARLVAGAANEDELLAEYDAKQTKAEGYYVWVRHLAELHQLMQTGISIGLGQIRMSEQEGLVALAAARAEFLRAHPGCMHCQAMLQCAGDVCWQCGKAQRRE
jgi:hypothetical protein